MNRTRTMLRFLLLIVFGLLLSSNAFAQATRTWVSGVGDDANPCSRTAPCKTFAGAISKTAAGGTIDVLDPGGFGAVTITNAITLETIGSIAGVLVSGTHGIVINAGPNDTVVLRGLSIDGIGTGLSGVKFLAGGKLVVERCTIQNFTQNGIDFGPAAVTSQLIVSDTTINNNTSAGIQVAAVSPGVANVAITRTRLLQNNYGILASSGVVNVRDSVFSANISAGARASGLSTPVTLNIDDSTISDSVSPGYGVYALGTQASVFVSRSIITNNGTGVRNAGGTISSSSDNRIFGNTNAGASMTHVAQQ